MNQLRMYLNLIQNMGYKYVIFRVFYELKRRSGVLKRKFPTEPQAIDYPLKKWKAERGSFFFQEKKDLKFDVNQDHSLKQRVEALKRGVFEYFNCPDINLMPDPDWVTNPITGYKYSSALHWSEINDFSAQAGDIKYVWEPSRFCFIYDIIRYDYHFNEDCSELVFSKIEDWINSNQINQGPNYKCSQEISLRCLNWMFAINYYSESPSLTESRFNKIFNAIYWQMHHVFHNLEFALFAVRNNHILTESLALYLVSLIFPHSDLKKWGSKGRIIFQREIEYQIYPDGSYLQHSFNYQRVVVQLLTWGLILSEKNGDPFDKIIYDRAEKCLMFMRTAMVDQCGHLPNYGANDGALFFRLNFSDYPDFRPAIVALATVLNKNVGISPDEDNHWYNLVGSSNPSEFIPHEGAHQFPIGGYYFIRESDSLTFIRCGKHRDRPSQADNLHVDIWYKGINYLIDSGSFRYNDAEAGYYKSTRAHNTLTLAGEEQMLKGSRFIWYYWSQAIEANLKEDDKSFIFNGSISAFTYLSKDIYHEREVVKIKDQPKWFIKDSIKNVPKRLTAQQIWNLPEELNDKVLLSSTDSTGNYFSIAKISSWYSRYYGNRQPSVSRVVDMEKYDCVTSIVIT